MRSAYSLRNIQFTGGTEERGTDIEYYEVIGPDKERFYTGIQVKRTKITASDAQGLITQGSRAFNKPIIDLASKNEYRISRWIVATTSEITVPAQREIHQQLAKHEKLVSFWDGVKLGELVFENSYLDFMSAMSIDPLLAGSSSAQVIWWDPDEPQVLERNFSSSRWRSIDISTAAPPTSSGVYITVKPIDSNFPPMQCAVRSTVDEIVIESVLSQVSPYFFKVEPDKTSVEAMLVAGDRPVDILCRGYSEFR